ncbi:MAG: WD40/YVTN/BNR-like repeat-containing protein [Candidatus Methylomirabilales bacterium]
MNTGRFRFHLFIRTAGPIVALVITLSPVLAPALQEMDHVHALVMPPGSHTLFLGTHNGLLTSKDEGQTWVTVPLPKAPKGIDVMTLVADPSNPQVLYAGTHERGVLRSRDGGKTWEDVNTGLGGRDVHAMTINPNLPKVLHAWVVDKGLYRTTDGGETWARVDDGPENPEVKTLASVNISTGMGGIYLFAGTATGLYRNPD